VKSKLACFVRSELKKIVQTNSHGKEKGTKGSKEVYKESEEDKEVKEVTKIVETKTASLK